jgi:hypothetical protein
MYDMKERVADACGGIAIGAAFLWLWIVASRADLAIVGF